MKFVIGIVAGVLVTSMLVVQEGNNMIRADLLASADSDAARDAINLANIQPVYPLKINSQLFYYVEKSSGGPEWEWRFQVQAMFPK
jgi:hypothetical protein